MTRVSATKLRQHLFEYLDKAAAGETVVIERNGGEVALLVPRQPANWREQMSTKPQLLVSADELLQPIEEIWEDYA